MDRFASSFLVFAQAAADAAKKQAADEPSLLSPWMMFVLVVLVIALPFGVGSLIARGLKMKDQANKIGVILFALTLGLSPFVAQYIIGALEQRQYEKAEARWQERQKARETIKKEDLDALVKAVPALQDNIQFDPQTVRKAAKKKPDDSGEKKTGEKSPGGKTAAKTNKTE